MRSNFFCIVAKQSKSFTFPLLINDYVRQISFMQAIESPDSGKLRERSNRELYQGVIGDQIAQANADGGEPSKEKRTKKAETI